VRDARAVARDFQSSVLYSFFAASITLADVKRRAGFADLRNSLVSMAEGTEK